MKENCVGFNLFMSSLFWQNLNSYLYHVIGKVGDMLKTWQILYVLNFGIVGWGFGEKLSTQNRGTFVSDAQLPSSFVIFFAIWNDQIFILLSTKLESLSWKGQHQWSNGIVWYWGALNHTHIHTCWSMARKPTIWTLDQWAHFHKF